MTALLIIAQVLSFYGLVYMHRDTKTNSVLFVGLVSFIPIAGIFAVLGLWLYSGGAERIVDFISTPLTKKNIWCIKEYKNYSYVLATESGIALFKDYKDYTALVNRYHNNYKIKYEHPSVLDYLETIENVVVVKDASNLFIPRSKRIY